MNLFFQFTVFGVVSKISSNFSSFVDFTIHLEANVLNLSLLFFILKVYLPFLSSGLFFLHHISKFINYFQKTIKLEIYLASTSIN